MYEVMNHHIFCVRECNDKNNFFSAEVGPKKILDLMNVPWLTRENVASHLQVYDLYLRTSTKVKSLYYEYCI